MTKPLTLNSRTIQLNRWAPRFLLILASISLSACAMMSEFEQRRAGTFNVPKSTPVDPDAPMTVEEQVESCNDGNPDDCYLLVRFAQETKNNATVYDFASKGCALKDLRSCQIKKRQDSYTAQLKKDCDTKKNGEACGRYGGVVGERGHDTEARFYIALGCRYKNERSCVFQDQMKEWDEKAEREKNRAALNQHQRNIAAQQAERDRQQRMIDAAAALSAFYGQQPAQTNQPTRCRTVSRPGNGLDGASAYYDTECK